MTALIALRFFIVHRILYSLAKFWNYNFYRKFKKCYEICEDSIFRVEMFCETLVWNIDETFGIATLVGSTFLPSYGLPSGSLPTHSFLSCYADLPDFSHQNCDFIIDDAKGGLHTRFTAEQDWYLLGLGKLPDLPFGGGGGAERAIARNCHTVLLNHLYWTTTPCTDTETQW